MKEFNAHTKATTFDKALQVNLCVLCKQSEIYTKFGLTVILQRIIKEWVKP